MIMAPLVFPNAYWRSFLAAQEADILCERDGLAGETVVKLQG